MMLVYSNRNGILYMQPDYLLAYLLVGHVNLNVRRYNKIDPKMDHVVAGPDFLALVRTMVQAASVDGFIR